MILIKRVYDSPSGKDGLRILVDRLWPRGLSKEKAKADLWLKEVAPSDSLREWFDHKDYKWEEFKKRYFEELKNKKDVIQQIKDRKGTITLLFGAKNLQYNNAVALKEYLKKD